MHWAVIMHQLTKISCLSGQLLLPCSLTKTELHAVSVHRLQVFFAAWFTKSSLSGPWVRHPRSPWSLVWILFQHFISFFFAFMPDSQPALLCWSESPCAGSDILKNNITPDYLHKLVPIQPQTLSGCWAQQLRVEHTYYKVRNLRLFNHVLCRLS